jgi:tetratricopeptide (TPR) repeat protein
MRRSSLFILFIAVMWCGAALGGTLQEQFQGANSAYWKKDYNAALEGYQSLVERFEVRNAALFFNLGNTHFQLGELGQAVYNYKRASARCGNFSAHSRQLRAQL